MNYETFSWKEVKDTYHDSKGKIYNAAGIFDELELERLKYALVDGIDIVDYFVDNSYFDFDALVDDLPEWKKAALTFLHYIPRSKMLPKATNAPRYHSLTPIFLWGLVEKWNNSSDVEAFNMTYSSWKGDKIKFAFPHMLWSAIEDASNWSRSDLMKQLGDLREARKSCLTWKTGKKQGQTEPNSSWKCNTLVLEHPEKGATRVNAMLLRLILQLWLANGAYRQDMMVLDPWDWDHMPELLDDVQPVQQTRIKRKVVEWEDL